MVKTGAAASVRKRAPECPLSGRGPETIPGRIAAYDVARALAHGPSSEGRGPHRAVTRAGMESTAKRNGEVLS